VRSVWYIWRLSVPQIRDVVDLAYATERRLTNGMLLLNETLTDKDKNFNENFQNKIQRNCY